VLRTQEKTAATHYDEEGGAEPSWGVEHNHRLTIDIASTDKTATVQVWNANFVLDDLISSATIDLETIPVDGKMRAVNVQLHPGGVLECQVAIIEAAHNVDQYHSAALVPGLSFSRVLCCEVHSVTADQGMTPIVSATLLPRTTHAASLLKCSASTQPAEEVVHGRAYFGTDDEPSVLSMVPAEEGTQDLLLEVIDRNFLLPDKPMGALLVEVNLERLQHWQRHRIELDGGKRTLDCSIGFCDSVAEVSDLEAAMIRSSSPISWLQKHQKHRGIVEASPNPGHHSSCPSPTTSTPAYPSPLPAPLILAATHSASPVTPVDEYRRNLWQGQQTEGIRSMQRTDNSGIDDSGIDNSRVDDNRVLELRLGAQATQQSEAATAAGLWEVRAPTVLVQSVVESVAVIKVANDAAGDDRAASPTGVDEMASSTGVDELPEEGGGKADAVARGAESTSTVATGGLAVHV
jgi:hypothetical protein